MKPGLIIYSTDSEVIWNAFRLGNFALNEGDHVQTFLLASGVDCEKRNMEKFNISEEMKIYTEKGGQILACGTCLKLRNSDGSELCPLSTMKDLYNLIKDCDKTVTF